MVGLEARFLQKNQEIAGNPRKIESCQNPKPQQHQQSSCLDRSQQQQQHLQSFPDCPEFAGYKCTIMHPFTPPRLLPTTSFFYIFFLDNLATLRCNLKSIFNSQLVPSKQGRFILDQPLYHQSRSYHIMSYHVTLCLIISFGCNMM